MKQGPKPRYKALIEGGALTRDPAQEDAVKRLQDLHTALLEYGNGRGFFGRSKPAPKGLYLWGDVGRGKTALMDIFFNNTPYELKRRAHFHEFMAEVHDRIAFWRSAPESEKRKNPAFDRKSPDDPIPLAAADIARDTLLFCFDEFQVTDIADAMILGRLFDALFSFGVVLVTTSNRMPDDLYKDGLNRQLFLPFIDTLKSQLDVLHLQSALDYRLEKLNRAPVYYAPLGPDADAAMDAAWETMICGAKERPHSFTVQGRDLLVKRTARSAARFSFSELCEQPLGGTDYLAIVRHFGAIFIDHIPIMSRDKRNEAKRFVTLIDTIYDSRTKLVCSADGEPGDLYPAGDGSFEFERTASRLVEMRSRDYLAAARTDFDDQ